MTQEENDTYRDGIDHYEYPFRITDYHGEVVADGLDNVPPLLNQEEIDTLSAHLTDTVIYDTAVADALKKLPDYEGGVGDVPPGVRFGCQKCDGEISPPEHDLTVAFGHFYHTECVE